MSIVPEIIRFGSAVALAGYLITTSRVGCPARITSIESPRQPVSVFHSTVASPQAVRAQVQGIERLVFVYGAPTLAVGTVYDFNVKKLDLQQTNFPLFASYSQKR